MTDPLTLWRAAAFAEPPQKTHQPATAQLGVDLSDQVVRYIIGGTDGRYMVRDAMVQLERLCRTKHGRWPDHRGRPVCYIVADIILVKRWSLETAALSGGVTEERAWRLFLLAVDYMRSQQRWWMEAIESTQKARHDPESCHECLLSDPIRRKDHDRQMCQTCRKSSAA